MYGSNQQLAQAPQAAFPSAIVGSGVGDVREIPCAASRLDSTIVRIRDLTDSLNGRLTGTVARQESPVPATAGVAPKAVMNTGLASHLDAMNDALSQAEYRIQSLLERLEF